VRHLAVLCVAAWACAGNGHPVPRKVDWVYAAYRPPPEYVGWWEDTEDCLGIRYEFKRVTWVVVRGRAFQLNSRGDSLAGYTILKPTGPTIMLAEVFWLNELVVRHEAVHAITGRGHSNLPAAAFDCAKGGEDADTASGG
jgi:hypothetical protein